MITEIINWAFDHIIELLIVGFLIVKLPTIIKYTNVWRKEIRKSFGGVQ